MSKFNKLKEVLEKLTAAEWRVTFNELQKLIDVELPASAWKYPGWWSNNPSNNSMTKIWLQEGWYTEQVDIDGQTIVFKREQDGNSTEGQSGMAEEMANYNSGSASKTRSPLSGEEYLSSFYGCMETKISIAPDVDITTPTGEAWNAEKGIL